MEQLCPAATGVRYLLGGSEFARIDMQMNCSMMFDCLQSKTICN